jgi:hypothetical protein
MVLNRLLEKAGFRLLFLYLDPWEMKRMNAKQKAGKLCEEY